MSENHTDTPRTQDVRERYALSEGGLNFRSVAQQRGEAFDRWLADHDQDRARRAAERITTVEDLDALPLGSLVLSYEEVFERITPNPRINGGEETWRCLHDAFDRAEYRTCAPRDVLPFSGGALLLHRAGQSEAGVEQ